MKAQKDWKKVIAHQQASGLSIAAYCRSHKIAPATFYKYRKQFSKLVAFTEIVPSLEETNSTLSFTINKTKLEVSKDISKEDLAKIFQALLYD